MLRATLKNYAPKLCNVARGSKAGGQHWTTERHYFQCWRRLTVNICFVISRNKCNKFVSSSMTQQHRIRIDLPNTALGLKKIDANAWCHVVYTMFPGNMNHVMSCSPGTWRCTDETGRHFLFLHITWRALDQSRSRNSDRDVTIQLVVIRVSVICELST